MEEGTALQIPGDEIGLVTGEEAHFRFFSSSTRRDPPGAVLSRWTEDEIQETAPLTTTLPAADGHAGDYVPVRFEVPGSSHEPGTFESSYFRIGFRFMYSALSVMLRNGS